VTLRDLAGNSGWRRERPEPQHTIAAGGHMRLHVLAVTSLCTLVTVHPAYVADIARDAAASQAATAAPLVAAADQTLTSDGITLRYKDVGSGEAAVLIHGYSANLESLSAVASALTSTHRVIALDVRGFGKSSKFAEPARFGQSMTDDVVRLMDHLKITRAHLLGHSMGALIAANVASRYPARVASATLVAGPFYADRTTFEKESAKWVADLESGAGLTNFLQWLFPKMDAKIAAGASAMSVKQNDLPSLIAVMRSLPDLAIPGLKAPAVSPLVVVGTGDPLQPLSQSFAKASPGATLVEIDGADHINIVASPELLRSMKDQMQAASKATAKPQREAA
jgi:pimeloyl-ACP methyl ester carboxylesterase